MEYSSALARRSFAVPSRHTAERSDTGFSEKSWETEFGAQRCRHRRIASSSWARSCAASAIHRVSRARTAGIRGGIVGRADGRHDLGVARRRRDSISRASPAGRTSSVSGEYCEKGGRRGRISPLKLRIGRTSAPVVPVQTAILHRLGNVLRRDVFGAGHIRDGPGHLEDAVVRTRGKPQPAHRHFQRTLAGIV